MSKYDIIVCMKEMNILKKIKILALLAQAAEEERVDFSQNPCSVSELPDLIDRIEENSLRNRFFGDLPPADGQEVLRPRMSKLFKMAASTQEGQRIFCHLPRQTRLLCCEGEQGHKRQSFGSSLPKEAAINIEPRILQHAGNIDGITTIVHEAAHIMHHKLKEQHPNKNELNPYDLFFLDFLDECGAVLAEHKAKNEIVYQKGEFLFDKLGAVFNNRAYTDQFLMRAERNILLDNRPMEAMKRTHSKAFYDIQRHYFKMYPELKNSLLVHQVHKSYRVAANRAASKVATPHSGKENFCQ